MYVTIKNSVLLLLCCICIVSCTETNKKNAYDESVDIMKSEVLIDTTIKESWALMQQGQKLANQDKSAEEIVKILPQGTLYSTNNTSIMFFIEGSMPMVIEFNNNPDQKIKFKGGLSGISTNPNISTSQSLTINTSPTSFFNKNKLVDVIGSEKGEDQRQKKKALIISTDIAYFGKDDDGLIAYKYLSENRNYKDNVTYLKDSLVLEDFTSFAKYDLVHLSAHGENFCETTRIKDVDSEEGFVFEEIPIYKCELWIKTNIKHGMKDISDPKEFAEFKKKYRNKYKGLVSVSSTSIYLRDTFFGKIYAKGLNDKIWVFSACELGQNNVLSNSMKGIHENGHFFYWQNTVNSSDAFKAFDKFYENLTVKGLDAKIAYEKTPTKLRSNLKSSGSYTENDSIIKYKTSTSLLHMQTGDPRHGIEVIDMLNPENDALVEFRDKYPIKGTFNDGKNELLTLKVKLIGYTQAEFLEKKMRISLEVDDKIVLSELAFLPVVPGYSKVESIKGNKYGVILTISDIEIPDVRKKTKLTLKAVLHLNDDHISIHKEQVSISEFYFKVKIDGVEHSFENMLFVNASPLKLGIISINPNNDNGGHMAIGVDLTDKDSTGTFIHEFYPVYLKKGEVGVWDDDIDNGTITILENNDHYVKGTFSFKGSNRIDGTTKEFTEGRFKARKLKKKK